MPQPARAPAPIRIKHYARARLYYAAERRYVSVDELRTWAERGVPFAVIDAETKADITRALLA